MHIYRTLLVFLLIVSAHGADYFVGKGGDDQQDGRSRATAFRTIQKGVDALQPGDTLTIGPGEYHEAVSRAGLGSDEAETVIRAAIPGTVLLRGNIPLQGFEKVPGDRFVYVTDCPQEPQSVAEVDSLEQMNTVLYQDEVEFLPGTYFYDAKAQKLYLSTTDLRPPAVHRLRVAVRPATGLFLESPVRVTIEGLAATGFHANVPRASKNKFGCEWGIYLENPTRCTVRDCTTYLNGGGIAFHEGEGHNTIEFCTSYANNSRFNQEGGNIAIYRGGPHDVLRDNVVFLSDTYGQRFYISNEDDLRMLGGLGWGNNGNFWIKGMRGPDGAAWAERMIDLAKAPARDHRHSLVFEGPVFEGAVNSIHLAQEENLDLDAEFADPHHFDFRLQSTSRFRGAGDNGVDLGPFPYQPIIHYVKPDGDDGADGLSVGAAWRTIGHALAQVQAGDTLYLLGGTYGDDVTASLSGITIRRRGLEPVLLTGKWELTAAVETTLQRLTFTGDLTVVAGRELELDNCAFMEESGFRAEQVDSVRVTHCVFMQTADFGESGDLYLAGNLYAATPGIAIASDEHLRYSGYNSYARAVGFRQVAGKAINNVDVQSPYERFGTPQLSLVDGEVRFANRHVFDGMGPLGTSIGLWFAGEPKQLRLAGPFVHSTTATTANLEWWTSVPAIVEFAWGETPACANRRELHHHQFASHSLTGLQPGTTYHYRVRVLEQLPGLPDAEWVTVGGQEAVTGSFTTAVTDPAPRTLYVAPDGDDSHDGLSRQTAWRSLNTAANRVRPGDTVLVAGGTYHETAWLRVTGEEGRSITFRAMPGERVQFDGNGRRLLGAFVTHGKHHLILDGFHGVDFGRIGGHAGAILALDKSGMFVFSYSTDIQVRRCLMDGRGTGYSPGFLIADSCANFLMENCVAIGGFGRTRFLNTPNLRVEHNVFFRNLIQHLTIINHSDQPARIASNIFTDSLKVKRHAASITIGRAGAITAEDNCFYPRELDPEKHLFFLYSDEAFERERVVMLMPPPREAYPVHEDLLNLTLSELPPYLGETDSLIANPQFKGLQDVPADKAYDVDHLHEHPVSFSDFFATDPAVRERGMGLQPAAFEDVPLKQGD